jgi:phosphatidylserine synthase
MMVITMMMWFALRFDWPGWVMAVTFLGLGLLMTANIKLRKYGPWQRVLWGIGLAFVVYVMMS